MGIENTFKYRSTIAQPYTTPAAFLATRVGNCLKAIRVDPFETGFDIRIACLQLRERTLEVLRHVVKRFVQELVPLPVGELLANPEIAGSLPLDR